MTGLPRDWWLNHQEPSLKTNLETGVTPDDAELCLWYSFRTTNLRDVSLRLNCRFNVAEHYSAVRLSQDVHDNLAVHERSD
jgi:hypothetical protein